MQQLKSSLSQFGNVLQKLHLRWIFIIQLRNLKRTMWIQALTCLYCKSGQVIWEILKMWDIVKYYMYFPIFSIIFPFNLIAGHNQESQFGEKNQPSLNILPKWKEHSLNRKAGKWFRMQLLQVISTLAKALL